MKGRAVYLDGDAVTYVARDVSSGVVVSGDTGSYPFDMLDDPVGTDLKTSSCRAVVSSCEWGHETGNADRMTWT